MMAANLNPTTYNSSGGSWTSTACAAVGNQVFFVGDDNNQDVELWVTNGSAEGTHRVKDINPGPASSFPSNFANAFGKLLFTAVGESHRPQFWISDGTEIGTTPLTPAVEDTIYFDHTPIAALDKVFFVSHESGVAKLWVSGGDAASTMPLLSVSQEVTSPPAIYLFRANSRFLFFQTPSGLWRTDGTIAGTILLSNEVNVDDIRQYHSFTILNDRFYLSNNNRTLTSDGTLDGTHLNFGDYFPILFRAGSRLLGMGPSTSPPWSRSSDFWYFDDSNGFDAAQWRPFISKVDWVVSEGDIAYFLSNDALWKTDGTIDGTRVVKPFSSDELQQVLGGSFSSNYNFTGASTPAGLVFPVGESAWRTDGTKDGTFRVGNAGHDSTIDVVQSRQGVLGKFVGVVGNRALAIDTPRTGLNSVALTSGEESLAFHNPGVGKIQRTIASTGAYAVFAAQFEPEKNARYQAWRVMVTDGTAGGTRVLREFSEPVRDVGSTFKSIGVVDGTIVIGSKMDPDVPYDVDAFSQLWGFSRESAQPQLLLDGNALGRSNFLISGFREKLAGPAGLPFVYYPGTDALGNHGPTSLGFTDGSSAGTHLIALGNVTLSGLDSGISGTWFNDRFYFIAKEWNDSSHSALWVSDGTPAGTRILENKLDPKVRQLAVSRNQLFVFGDNAIWVSDGTKLGTKLLASAGPTELLGSNVLIGDRTMFSIRNLGGDYFRQTIWTTDGTVAGTHALLDADGIPFVGYLQFESFTYRGKTRALAFRYVDESSWALWVTDGTTEGTELLVPRLPNIYMRFQPTVLNDRVVIGLDADIWSTDLTAAGTTKLGSSMRLPSASAIFATAELRGGATVGLFSAFDEEHGNEIWLTDGTEAGTRRVTDLDPGPASSFGSYGSPFLVDGHRLYFYFVASDSSRAGLWELDVESARTNFISSANQFEFDVAAHRLWFQHNDGTHGVEPWFYDPTPWQNRRSPVDVDNNGKVAPIDVLAIIDEINAHGAHAMPTRDLASPIVDPLVDVNGDDMVSPLDALVVIDYLNAIGVAGPPAGDVRSSAIAAAIQTDIASVAELDALSVVDWNWPDVSNEPAPPNQVEEVSTERRELPPPDSRRAFELPAALATSPDVDSGRDSRASDATLTVAIGDDALAPPRGGRLLSGRRRR